MKIATAVDCWSAVFRSAGRISDDYRDGLGLPLIMHLAELTSDYALPHEEADKADPDEDPEDDEPDQRDIGENEQTDA